ncbi:Carbon monoxide dehydrogenase medium chain [Variovorax sp. PBL-E5]|nr:Carbon monoxide dehydrogenase medium chain [Variovorax sp. PBL-E5]
MNADEFIRLSIFTDELPIATIVITDPRTQGQKTMRRFEYNDPQTIPEAIALMARLEGAKSLFAGGTDLLVEIREHIRRPAHLIDLKKIAGLDGLAFDAESGLRCGALVTVRRIETSPIVRQHYRGLMSAARELGSIQVRNRATLGGNVCRASPSADTLPPLVADGARATLEGAEGRRNVALEDFFTGPGRTLLQSDEILVEFQIPAPLPHTGKSYLKHGRRKAMELATVGVAVTLSLHEGRVSHARIVLGAVAPTPLRALRAEALLMGEKPNDAVFAAAAQAALEESRPITDVRASADYRRRMVGVLTHRALTQALEAVQ